MTNRRNITDRRPDASTQPLLLFFSRKIDTAVAEMKRDLGEHVVHEEREFRQIFKAIHDLRVSRAAEANAIKTYTLKEVLKGSLTTLKFTSMVLYFFTMLGFCFHGVNLPTNGLQYLLNLLPHSVWILLMFSMWFGRGVGLFWWVGNRLTNIASPVLGIWIWSMMLVSAAMIDHTYSMSGLYLVPLALEAWILARAFSDWRGRSWV